MLFDPLDSILGTATKVRLIRALVPLDRRVSGREAARLAGVSHIAQRALDDLAEAGILTREETAGQYLYSFYRKHVLAPSLEMLFDGEREYTRAAFDRMAAVIDQTEAVASAIVFGSAARGEARPQSDLDILVLVDHSDAKKSVYDALVRAAPEMDEMFGLRVSPVAVTVEQALRQQAENDPFIGEALRDGRRICGRPLEEVLSG